MPIYQGDKKIVDRYIGETLITRAYQGDKLIFDAYSELSGTLPLAVRSRASQVLKNYIIYGTASGAGVETENLFNGTDISGSFNNKYYNDDFLYANLSQGTYTLAFDLETTVNRYMSSIGVGSIAYSKDIQVENNNTDGHFVFTFTIEAEDAGKNLYARFLRFKSATMVPVTYTASNIMLVEGSTAPSSYIPHGYKLPITVTSNGTTTDYPIYIGSTKLGEEEYVDYESGKVYKRTENLFDKDSPDIQMGKEISGTLIVDRAGWFVTQYILVEPEQKYIAKNSGVAVLEYDENYNLIRRNSGSARSGFITSTTTKFIKTNVEINKLNTIMLVEGFTVPETYIPYLQPTDPPVPLPDITLPQGIVTIDTKEEFKYNSTVKGRINSVHYAYRINPDTAEITYLADNKNFTPAAMGATDFDYGSWENAFFMPRPCMLKSNGKVDYYLDPNDYSKKLDGTASDIADPTYDGNVMLEFPKIWYKFVPTGDDGEGGTFHCSNVKLDDDYECWCNYDANNNEIDHFYVAAYNAVILDGKMRSLSGYALTQENGADTTTGTAEIAAARANNQNDIDEWYTYLLADHQLLTHLATLMCKHVNHQTKFGRGIDSGSTAAKRAYVTGTLNDKGLFWGDTSSGTQAVKIFGIENFYACVWKRTAGLIGTSTGYVYKLTHGTKDGSTATSFNTNGSGYKTIARTKPANGYVTIMHYESNGFWIPATTGTIRYGDYYYNGNGYAFVGGGSASGSTCGSWCVNLSGGGVSGSVWSFSSALSCKPRALASGS